MTNRFQYTAREFDSESGLYYYRARYFDPNPGRFLTEDPKRFSEAVDFYLYVRNSPSNFLDPSGLTCTSNTIYLGQWLVGVGKRNRFYGPDDPETKEMKDSIAADKLRKQFRKNGCQSVYRFAYGSFEAAWDTLLNPFTNDWCGTLAEVGGFAGASMLNNGDGTATVNISPDGSVSVSGTIYPSVEVWKYQDGQPPQLMFNYNATGGNPLNLLNGVQPLQPSPLGAGGSW